ncbi:hypothetical protein Brsp07_04632 [Brucella sp. NBRC 14130]|uniref:hypothetical protein n=1 Tax=Brucella sp. NBRC 14130 TaxID=3075483 RepID=UPI0030B470C9
MLTTLEIVTRKTAEGDIYEATRDDARSPWEICFPTGQERFYGSKSEVSSEIGRIMKAHGAVPVAN